MNFGPNCIGYEPSEHEALFLAETIKPVMEREKSEYVRREAAEKEVMYHPEEPGVGIEEIFV